MKLLTKEIEKSLPAFYETEEVGVSEKVLRVKYFTPWSNWTWYGVEYSPGEEMFFGYVKGPYPEWGYFSLKELREIKGPAGLKVERDLYLLGT